MPSISPEIPSGGPNPHDRNGQPAWTIRGREDMLQLTSLTPLARKGTTSPCLATPMYDVVVVW